MIASQLLEWGKYRGITEGATHYHATYVSPRWAKDLQQIGRLGAHIFYRWDA
jgi:spore germination cell wall hydrolase CwlJ-like protein